MISAVKRKGGSAAKFSTKESANEGSALVSAQVASISKFGGHMVRGNERGNTPRTFEEMRYCPVHGCGKKLSVYNRGPACYTHTPAKASRVRGRKPPVLTLVEPIQGG